MQGFRTRTWSTISLLSVMSTCSAAFAFPVSFKPLVLRSCPVSKTAVWRLNRIADPAMSKPNVRSRATIVSCADGPPEDPNRVSVTGSAYKGPDGTPVVTLFTKAECTLCDKVKAVLKDVKEVHPHSLQQTDITDPEHRQWWDRYKYDIPVLHIGEKFWTKHRLTEEEAVAALSEATSGNFEERKGQPDASRLERS